MTIQTIRRFFLHTVSTVLKGNFWPITRAVVTRGTWSKTPELWCWYDIPTYQRRGIHLTMRSSH